MMRKIQPPVIPEDIQELKEYLKQSIVKQATRYGNGKPFICSCSLDWRDEAIESYTRLARFTIECSDGVCSEQEILPPEYDETRKAIEYQFEAVAAIHKARYMGWLSIPFGQVLSDGIICNNLAECSNYAYLWPGCGLITLTMLSTRIGEPEPEETIRDILADTFRLMQNYEPYEGIREFDADFDSSDMFIRNDD